MKAEEKHQVKEALRKAKYLKSKEKGKRVNLTREEMVEVINGKIALTKLMGGIGGRT